MPQAHPVASDEVPETGRIHGTLCFCAETLKCVSSKKADAELDAKTGKSSPRPQRLAFYTSDINML